MTANHTINLPGLRVTALANRGKRRAARPAGYRERYKDMKGLEEQRNGSRPGN